MKITRRHLLLSLIAAPFVPRVVETAQPWCWVSKVNRPYDAPVLGLRRIGDLSFTVNFKPDGGQTST